MEQYKINLLKLLGEQELWTTIFWSEDLEFCIPCNDFFSYASADAEQITSQEDVDLLEESLEDCREINEEIGFLLFCCRKRKFRPMRAAYKNIDEKLWGLFNSIYGETLDKEASC